MRQTKNSLKQVSKVKIIGVGVNIRMISIEKSIVSQLWCGGLLATRLYAFSLRIRIDKINDEKNNANLTSKFTWQYLQLVGSQARVSKNWV